ncbi:MAG: hypothetical protein KFKLKKLM_01029 [Flavobacteriales bacterium]|nr:hypothetical protein [Flavobacteriales bacterium]
MQLLEIENLNYYADLAYKILEKSTNYNRGKKIISEIFKIQPNNDLHFSDIVILRLTVIDSYYSTQMNKRLFGIEDIANKIEEFKTDDFLKKQCEIFLVNPTETNSNISKLFENNYGIQKNGKESGQAASLISKYLYFLMKYEFPIYDSLAKQSYSTIKSNYQLNNIQKIGFKFSIDYFQKIKTFKEFLKIESYNKLDNLLWLIGKVNKKSFSLILNRDSYIKQIKDERLNKFILFANQLKTNHDS